MVKVDVEFCGFCDFETQCKEFSSVVKSYCQDANVIVTCKRGRRGAFEVTIDGVLVYSKLSTLVFPEYTDIAHRVKDAVDGKPIKPFKEKENCLLS